VLRTAAIALLALVLAAPAFSVVNTTFDEPTLNPAVALDVPSPSDADVTLDTTNDELDFTSANATDLWVARNNAPIAWSAAPSVGSGEKWFVETEVRFDTPVSATHHRVAGITFYGGPDGSGGSGGGMDFTFGINNWDDRFDPGYVGAIEVQGLGDNDPLISAPWSSPNAFLRVEVTELGASDHYEFFYRANNVDPWTPLGSYDSTVANSRAALFLKTFGDGTTADRAASFTYFVVEPLPAAVPATDSRTLMLMAIAMVLIGFAATRSSNT
jgi:hypothetical protein